MPFKNYISGRCGSLGLLIMVSHLRYGLEDPEDYYGTYTILLDHDNLNSISNTNMMTSSVLIIIIITVTGMANFYPKA
jgi:hypothetical protein